MLSWEWLYLSHPKFAEKNSSLILVDIITKTMVKLTKITIIITAFITTKDIIITVEPILTIKYQNFLTLSFEACPMLFYCHRHKLKHLESNAYYSTGCHLKHVFDKNTAINLNFNSTTKIIFTSEIFLSAWRFKPLTFCSGSTNDTNSATLATLMPYKNKAKLFSFH
jgi:hypothetical protein